MKPILFAVAIAMVIASAGCSKPKPALAPVTVKNKVLDRAGKPLKDAVLTLTPTGPENAASRPTVPVGADGTLTVECLPGPYTATFAPLPRQGHADAPSDGGIADHPSKADPAISKGVSAMLYRSVSESPWKITVKSEGNEEFVLKMNF